MKKYKLIKEYPGSPSLGTVVDNNYINNLNLFTEFWEEVVEKEYEILSVIDNRYSNCLITWNDSRYNFKAALEIIHSKKYAESNLGKNIIIHSVKRLSDGEIFTIGDVIKPAYARIQKIVSFINPEQNNYFVEIETGCASLKKLEKVKTPLFTTEDGVNIFKGDNYHVVSKESFFRHNCTADQYGFTEKKYLTFSTKEAAEKYIVRNKPCLSLKDVEEYCIRKSSGLQQLVRSKLKL